MTRDKRLKPMHPGEILREELLTPLNISGKKLAQELKKQIHPYQIKSKELNI